jgi:hypothetical protein
MVTTGGKDLAGTRQLTHLGLRRKTDMSERVFYVGAMNKGGGFTGLVPR